MLALCLIMLICFVACDNDKEANLVYNSKTYSNTTESSKYNSENKSNNKTSGSTCQYKNNNGSRTCTNKATRGQLCEYHFKMLDDIYNDIAG